MTMGELIDEYGWPPSMWPEEYRPKDRRILLLQEIRQEITEIPMTIQCTRCFNEREISDYRSDILKVIDKHIKEIE